MNKIQKQAVSAIRVISSEAIDKAGSGHPGLPLGCATMAFTLFSKFLSFNPKDPNYYNRDRFVLSAGHGSMLLYSLLHIFGYQVSMDDIKNFRQLGSKTPGHPEHGVTPGVEVSTGPLGQGIANAVGFAIAETMMAARYNEPGFEVVDHYTYALCGDGCMMEGIESEAASLAGTLKLGKLIVLYDSNNITIEGDTSAAFTEDVAKRHEAQGWQVIKVADGEDMPAITRAIQKAQRETLKPSLIVIETKIGYGSELEGDAACHGSPLGKELTDKLKAKLNYDYPPFTVPDEVYTYCRRIGRRNAKKERAWQDMLDEYKKKYPLKYEQFNREISGKTVMDFFVHLVDQVSAGACRDHCDIVGEHPLPGGIGGHHEIDAPDAGRQIEHAEAVFDVAAQVDRGADALAAPLVAAISRYCEDGFVGGMFRQENGSGGDRPDDIHQFDPQALLAERRIFRTFQ